MVLTSKSLMLNTRLYFAFLMAPSIDSNHSWLLLLSAVFNWGKFPQQSNTLLKIGSDNYSKKGKIYSYPLTRLMKIKLFHSVRSTCQCVSELEKGLKSERFLSWFRSRARPVSLWIMWTNIVASFRKVLAKRWFYACIFPVNTLLGVLQTDKVSKYSKVSLNHYN